jgi:uncharacterized RDD family membrane protein YckC
MTNQNNKSIIGRRIAASVIDYIVIFLLTILYIFNFGTPNEAGGYTVKGISALFPVFFWVIYLVVPEWYAGGTLGHKLVNLKVVPIRGEKISLIQVFKRRISDGLEIVWCLGLIAYMLVKNTPLNQRLGDLWAKTIVVDKSYKYSHQSEL